MTKQDYTAIMMIVDRSRSMSSIREEAENTLNNYIKEQAGQPGKCTVRLVDFDHEYRLVQKTRSVNRFPKYSLEPRGMTALYDAIGYAVTEFGQELSDLTESDRPARVLVVIITDGEENSSKEYRVDQVRNMIKHQESVYDWKFVFLAANQDAALSGSKIGIQANNTLNFDATNEGITRSGVELSNYTRSYRDTGQASF